MYSCEFALITFFSFGHRRAGRRRRRQVKVKKKKMVQIIQEEQQKEKTGEGQEGEDVEIIEDPEREEEAQELELMAPPGDWWGTLYTFDQVKEMIDELPKKVQSWNETNRKKRKRTKQ